MEALALKLHQIKPKKFSLKVLIFICMAIMAINIYYYFNKPRSINTGDEKGSLAVFYNNNQINNIVNVPENGEAEFDVHFSYAGNREKNYNLSVFWDYKQCPFKVNDKTYSLYEIKITNKTYSDKIHIKLDKQFKGMNNLIIRISDNNSFNDERIPLEAQYRYILLSNSSKSVDSSYYETPYKTYNQSVKDLFVINTDKSDNIDKYVKNKYWDENNIVKAKANSELDLDLRLGNLIGTGDTLIIGELDGKQIKLNGKDYLKYKFVDQDTIFRDKIKLSTPDKPGKYLFKAILVKHPFDSDAGISSNVLYISRFQLLIDVE